MGKGLSPKTGRLEVIIYATEMLVKIRVSAWTVILLETLNVKFSKTTYSTEPLDSSFDAM